MPTPAKHVGKVLRPFVYDEDWKRAMPSNPPSTNLKVTKKDEAAFSEVAKLIAASKEKVFQAVNPALIDLYWNIGATISKKIETAEWGDGVVERLAQFIARTEPGLRGFTRRNLFRMRQFYEAYKEESIMTPVVTQLPWSHHLIILGQSKRVEEREFYIRMAIRVRRSRRELERQFRLTLAVRQSLSVIFEDIFSRQRNPLSSLKYF